MSRRRCSFCCEKGYPLFGLPKTEELRLKWLEFIYSNRPYQHRANSFVCSQHFTEESFYNLNEFNAGRNRRLTLKDNAIPTLIQREKPKLQLGNNFPPYKHVSCQTDREDQWTQRRSVATQLSMGTLQNVRSKATQANVPSRDLGVGTTTFPLDNLQIFLQPTVTETSSKRPRLELKEEEERDHP